MRSLGILIRSIDIRDGHSEWMRLQDVTIYSLWFKLGSVEIPLNID